MWTMFVPNFSSKYVIFCHTHSSLSANTDTSNSPLLPSRMMFLLTVIVSSLAWLYSFIVDLCYLESS